MNSQHSTVWTALIEPVGGLEFQILFQPAAATVVDVSPLTLDGGVTVWFDPLLPERPQRIVIPDLRLAAFSLAPLLGEEAFGVARDFFLRLSQNVSAHDGQETLVRVHRSGQWDSLSRWALAQWLRDDVPTDLDPGWLDVEIASNASAVAVLLGQKDLDRLDRLWQLVTERLLMLARRCAKSPFGKVAHHGILDLVGRAVRAAAGFLDPEDDEQTQALVELATFFPAAEDAAVTSQWLNQLYVDTVFTKMIVGLQLSMDTPADSPENHIDPLAQQELAATLSGAGSPSTSATLSATDSVDWWQVPHRTVADDEDTVRWAWNSGTRQLQVEVPADSRAIQDGRWHFDLRFQLVHESDSTVIAAGPLIPRVADGLYRGEVLAALDVPLSGGGDLVVDVYACSNGVDSTPAVGNARRHRAARREAARGTTTCRRLRLLQGIASTDRPHVEDETRSTPGTVLDVGPASAQQVRFILESKADTAWQAAAAGYSNLRQHQEELRCQEQLHVSTDQPLLGSEEPTLAEYDLLGLLES